MNTLFLSLEMDAKLFQERLFRSLKIPQEILLDSEPRFSGAATAMKQMEKSLHGHQKEILNQMKSIMIKHCHATISHFSIPADPTSMVDLDPEGSRIKNKSW